MTDLAIVLFTLRMAALSTLLILPFALGLAAWSWRAGAKGLVLDAIGALPLVVPPTAIGFVLLELLSRRAPIGRLLDRIGIDVLFTPKAVVIAWPTILTGFACPCFAAYSGEQRIAAPAPSEVGQHWRSVSGS